MLFFWELVSEDSNICCLWGSLSVVYCSCFFSFMVPVPGYLWLQASYCTKEYLSNYLKPGMRVPPSTKELCWLLACLGSPWTQSHDRGPLENQSSCNQTAHLLVIHIHPEGKVLRSLSLLCSGKVYHYSPHLEWPWGSISVSLAPARLSKPVFKFGALSKYADKKGRFCTHFSLWVSISPPSSSWWLLTIVPAL